MSGAQRDLQPSPSAPQQSEGHADVVRELNDFPRVMVAREMAAFFRYNLKVFYRKASAGDFDFALIKSVEGGLRYDRERVRQHVEGTNRGLTGFLKRA